MNYKPIKEVRDQLKDFDCGNDDLNVYLKAFIDKFLNILEMNILITNTYEFHNLI